MAGILDRQDITPIGITNWREVRNQFGIKDADRLGHIYVLGKTGTGKSTLLKNMVISDMSKGKGVAVIDPHGDLTQTLLDFVPAFRLKDVIYFNSTDHSFPIAFNPLANIDPRFHHLVASGFISSLKKSWADSWGPRLEHILRFSILTLLEYGEATLLDIQPLLTNELFRSKVIRQLKNPHLISFWSNEQGTSNSGFRSEAISPILNKLGLFVASAPLRNIFGQKSQGFDLNEVLNGSKILLVNLAKGLIGEDASALLGGMIVTAIQHAALFRSHMPPEQRVPFYLYVDEMQTFISLSFAEILSESRKYGLSLFLAHQYIDQLQEQVRSAIFGNVGTMVSFRIGINDARILAKEFFPTVEVVDFINLPKHSFYLKMMIDGETSAPFSASSIPPRVVKKSFRDEIIDHSRAQYSNSRDKVEREIVTAYFQKGRIIKPTLF